MESPSDFLIKQHESPERLIEVLSTVSNLTIRIVHRLSDVPQNRWDALAAPESPFLAWDWLTSLEEAECVTAEKGWGPHHILAERDGQLVGAVPLYLKGHSEGEFVFDYQFAHAAQNAGIPYYPKLLVAVPFTPATGVRVLTAPKEERGPLIGAMSQVLRQVCTQNEFSSVHVNFCTEEEAHGLTEAGYLIRKGMQYQWHNKGYQTFEDYLSEFRSKRRTKIRRERREMADQGITIHVRRGDQITPDMAPVMYQLYRDHVERLYWGRRYLNLRFFEMAVARFRHHLCFITAERKGRVIAGTFNVQKDGVFYGRYWGAFEEVPFLHFNVCYYAAIEHCIADGVQRFEPGAGGEFKQLRGFDPQPTHSAHFFAHPGLQEAVADYLRHEARHMDNTIDHLTQTSQLKSTRKG